MKGYNRAGLEKRVTTHPDRTRRREEAKVRQGMKRSTKDQIAWLNAHGYVALRERSKLAGEKVMLRSNLGWKKGIAHEAGKVTN